MWKIEPRWRPLARAILYVTGVCSVSVLAWLGWAYKPKPSFDQRSEHIFALAKEQRYEEARAAALALEAEFPNAVKVPLLIGYLFEVQERFSEARNEYLRAVKRAPRDDQKRDLMLSVSDLYRREKLMEEARKTLEDAVRAYGESERSRRVRVALFVEERQFKDALSEVDRLDEEHPGNPHASKLRAYVSSLTEPKASIPRAPKAVVDPKGSVN